MLPLLLGDSFDLLVIYDISPTIHEFASSSHSHSLTLARSHHPQTKTWQNTITLFWLQFLYSCIESTHYFYPFTVGWTLSHLEARNAKTPPFLSILLFPSNFLFYLTIFCTNHSLILHNCIPPACFLLLFNLILFPIQNILPNRKALFQKTVLDLDAGQS